MINVLLISHWQWNLVPGDSPRIESILLFSQTLITLSSVHPQLAPVQVIRPPLYRSSQARRRCISHFALVHLAHGSQ